MYFPSNFIYSLYLQAMNFPEGWESLMCSSSFFLSNNLFQIVFPGEYLSYCPGTRYRTCSDCYLDIPNCQHLSDGIHTIPAGLFVSQGFVYCLDQRSLVYSECPPEYVYLSTAQTCVLRSSLITTEPAEVKWLNNWDGSGRGTASSSPAMLWPL